MITNPEIDASLPLGHYFAILSKAYVGALFKRLENCELDRYYIIIPVLHDAEEPFTQHSLGQFLNVDKVTMVRVVDHLVKLGMVERVNNPADRREKFIVLTESGKKLTDEIKRAIAEINHRALNGFSTEQRRLLNDMLRRMNENLSAVPSRDIYVNFKRSRKK